MLYVGLNPWEDLATTPVALPAALQAVAGQADKYRLKVGEKELVFVPYFDVPLESYHTYSDFSLSIQGQSD